MCILSLIGAVLEGLGFVLVVSKLVLIQWREVGAPRWWVRLRAAGLAVLRALRLRRRPVTGTANLKGQARARASGSATVTTRRSPPSLEERMQRLEAAQEQQHQHNTALAQSIAEVLQHANATRAELQRQQKERESERRKVTSASVKLEAAGTAFFVAGVILTGIAAVTC